MIIPTRKNIKHYLTVAYKVAVEQKQVNSHEDFMMKILYPDIPTLEDPKKARYLIEQLFDFFKNYLHEDPDPGMYDMEVYLLIAAASKAVKTARHSIMNFESIGSPVTWEEAWFINIGEDQHVDPDEKMVLDAFFNKGYVLELTSQTAEQFLLGLEDFFNDVTVYRKP